MSPLIKIITEERKSRAKNGGRLTAAVLHASETLILKGPLVGVKEASILSG